MKFTLKKGDLILIISVVLVAGYFIGLKGLTNDDPESTGAGKYATIRVDNEIIKTVKLTREPQTIEIKTDQGYDILKIRDEGIEVIESDCPQKICFTYGLISNPQEVIICLPLRMIIEVHDLGEKSGDDEVDAYVR